MERLRAPADEAHWQVPCEASGRSIIRYLIDSEFRDRSTQKPSTPFLPFASALRRELSERNIRWALDHGCAHEVSLGSVPAVLYREDAAGCHGNFLEVTYRKIQQNPAWASRLGKAHTSARHALLSRDRSRRELDSSNSSDALLMNVFCHPSTLETPCVRRLLGVDADVKAVFGYRPGTPLVNGTRDRTEADLRLGKLLIEAKLTEHDFQRAPVKLIERYSDVNKVFDFDYLEISHGRVQSYQLIRGVLAAHATPGQRYCVLCDNRRPDLIDAWHRVMMAVKPYDLRCCLQLLTWQELAATLPASLQVFLEGKYGFRMSID